MGHVEHWCFWTGLVLVGAMATGCRPPSDAPDGRRAPSDDPDRTEADTRFDENKSVFDAIRAADQLVVYEGLPRRVMFDKATLEEEKRKKETLTRRGFAFYREPLTVSAEDQTKLRGLFGDEGSFRAWRGEKKCGGFHPDYLVEWRTGEKSYRILICFGCNEVKVFTADKSLRCDIQHNAGKELEAVLNKYQKNRPPHDGV